MSKTESLGRSAGSKVRVAEDNIEVSLGDDSRTRVITSSIKVQKDDSSTQPPELPQDQGDVPQLSEEEKKLDNSKKKKKKYTHLLSDAPIKFSNVSFEHALTPEEKAAKRAAKKASKKEKKKGEKAEKENKPVVPETQDNEDNKAVEEKKSETATEGSGTELQKGKRKSSTRRSQVVIVETSKPDETSEKIDDQQSKEDAEKEKVGEDKVKLKKGKKGKKSKEDLTKSGSTSEISKEGKGKKKDKKDKKGQSQTKLSESSTDKSKEGKKKGKKDKKGKEKDIKKEEEAEADQSSEDDEDDKRIKKKHLGKSVSWIKEPKKKARKSASAMLHKRSSSLIRAKSKSKSHDLLKRGLSMASSLGSIVSLRSEDASRSRLSLRPVRSKTSKKKKRKRDSKSSWLFLDEDEESEEDDELRAKKKKGKKGKKGKKDVKEKVSAEPSPKEAEEKKLPEHKKEAKEPHEAAKGKKGKRKKKGKKESETTEAPAEAEAEDVMAQIMKMKAQAAAQVAAPAEEETAKEEPKGKKKKQKKEKKAKKKKKGSEEMFIVPQRKLTDAERVRQEAEKAEQARIQAEQEAQRKEEEERRRYLEELRLGREKEKRETAEQQLRMEQLSHSSALIKNMIEQTWNMNSKEKVDCEWEQYLKCDGLPDASRPAEINTYLHLWQQMIKDVSVEDAKHRTNEIIGLLEVLQDNIDDPFDAPESLQADWKWVKSLCREHQQESLDMATYRLLRDIESRLNRIDIPTANYDIIDENFKLCLWLYVQLATPMFNPRAQAKKPLEIEFSDMGLNVLFPATLDPKCMAIRAIYVKYDHLSDTSAIYPRPAFPAEINQDLFDMTAEEWYAKMKYKWEHRQPPPKRKIEDAEGNIIEVEDPEPEVLEGVIPPAVPYQKLEPSASRYEVDLEAEMYSRCRDNLFIKVDDKVVHLRKYIIIGGVYHLDLFYQPPQPHDQVAFDIRITALQIPKRLCEVPFYISYNLPPATDPDVRKPPEELEEELKQQEAELDKLIMITLTLPDHVMFLDLPIVCQWDKERKVWTTEDVHDVKHIEEKNYMTFRTGRFGPFALAVNRYINLPFQAWELRPELDGSVTFQLTCAILMVEFNVKNNRICLTQLQNSPNNALQDIVGIYYKLPKLMRVLQDGGIDLFPACDAFCYVDGMCEKHWPTEKHLYYNMAQLSPSYNFAWSRWNSQAGRRTIVLQMREYRLDKPKQKNHSMLLVTPLKATFIDTTEVSPAFTDTPIEGMKFYSDLYHLMKGTSTMATRNKIQNGPPDVAKTLSDLLIMTRVFSFS